MDASEIDGMSALSPFELKDAQIALASSHAERMLATGVLPAIPVRLGFLRRRTRRSACWGPDQLGRPHRLRAQLPPAPPMRHSLAPGLDPSDPAPPRIMAARCAALRNDPPASWDGVFVKTRNDGWPSKASYCRKQCSGTAPAGPRCACRSAVYRAFGFLSGQDAGIMG
jgi:hypothetical protein